MSLVSDNQSIQFLIWLNTEQLVLLPLSEVKELLDLLLLAHLGLLLLLLKVVFLQPSSLEFSLLSFVSSEPLCELLVMIAVRSFVDCDHKHCCWKESEDRLTGLGKLLRADWPS